MEEGKKKSDNQRWKYFKNFAYFSFRQFSTIEQRYLNEKFTKIDGGMTGRRYKNKLDIVLQFQSFWWGKKKSDLCYNLYICIGVYKYNREKEMREKKKYAATEII